jgi:hypothetical protein
MRPLLSAFRWPSCGWLLTLLLPLGTCNGQVPQLTGPSDSTQSPVLLVPAAVNPDISVSPILQFVAEDSSKTGTQHAGLLGKNYLDAQYMFAMPPSDFEDEMDPLHGFRTSLNVASPWASDSSSPLAQDLFASFRLYQTRAFDPAGPAELDLQAHDISLGTTLFAQVFQSARPFVQLGLQFTQTDMEIFLPGVFHFEETDRDTNLLMVAGCEFDLAQSTALRIAAELAFDPFNDTTLSAELIHWLNEHCFIRCGGMVTANAEMPGLLAGGGFAF